MRATYPDKPRGYGREQRAWSSNTQRATRVEGAGGSDGATGSRRIKVAHNFPRSVFKHRSKRCNSNDANSRFEAAAGELRATLPRNHACDRPRGPDLSRRGPARVKDWGSRPPTHIRIGKQHPDSLITYPDVHNPSTCAQPIQISPEGMAGNRGPGQVTRNARPVWRVPAGPTAPQGLAE